MIASKSPSKGAKVSVRLNFGLFHGVVSLKFRKNGEQFTILGGRFLWVVFYGLFQH